MLIKQDPVTSLWAREDGAVLLPPSGGRFKKFRWAFGAPNAHGYRVVSYKGKPHLLYQIICRAFHGLCPPDKCEIGHINRHKDDNRPENLRWVTHSENMRNSKSHDRIKSQGGTHTYEDRPVYWRERYDRRWKYRTAIIMADGKIHWVPTAIADRLLRLPVKERVLREQKEA